MLSSGVLLGLLGLSGLVALDAAPAAPPRVEWKTLEPGIEYATVTPPGPTDLPVDPRLHIVRIDPRERRLEAVMAGGDDNKLRPAGAWCRERHLAVAINMGMYEKDERTNTGYARKDRYVNNGHWATKYRAALAFAPTKPGVPPVLFADLDKPGDPVRLTRYGTVVQNLRLISPGRTSGRRRTAAGARQPSASTRRGASSSSSAATRTP